ncbi:MULTISPECIES: ABC transporter permease [unclassified Chelatococcus]|uniref:ABC transporter permease n=1 Tax=unclassified Chelatococcus TaxID=2638111 RepID=UPI001BCC11BC|nr:MULTISPECIES: ABC transporter permease [unclassified Chelatococcus]CAH1650235.1 Alkanesulfonates transport system permease protein [Hyphomicrobiales bacterium]MBS7743333.1 ABC transporter permease [Chelatococcus sp. HY11]MBX3541549.1 ABC transporter permease [Chelatococcus sp.]MCO5074559.1 ABC transporter permease [Chelatococcus sp.]CAH1692518.1 Alkanesulfonates transport system permease protein [Hyphomicrobiales bacterium]
MSEQVIPLRQVTARPAIAAIFNRASTVAVALLFPLAILLIWSWASARGWLPEQILPPPSYVWQAAVETIRGGDLLQHIGFSAARVALGFAIGAGVGLALGLAMGLFPVVDDYVRPTFTAIAQVPTLGWIPLLMLFLGIGEALKIVIIAKAAFVPVVLNTAAGIRSIPKGYMEVADAFQLTHWQRLRRLILPAAVPQIFTGIRYSLTKAWTALVAVELLASSEGLGYLLVWGRQMFWLDIMIFAMIVIGVVGYAMDAILARVEAHFQSWRVETIA